jgi:hypothetical protein
MFDLHWNEPPKNEVDCNGRDNFLMCRRSAALSSKLFQFTKICKSQD